MKSERNEAVDDEEGFLIDDRLMIRVLEESKEVTIQLPQGNDLTDCGRPVQMTPRCLTLDHLHQLPQCLNHVAKQPLKQQSTVRPSSRRSGKGSQLHQKTESLTQYTLNEIQSSSKRVYNGLGKMLYDFFQAGNYDCVFRKAADHRPMQEIIYDYTAQPKLLQLSNDYNPKLYRPLGRCHPLHPPHDHLSFDSSFQSGNLSRAFRSPTSHYEYFLLLDNDTNTHGYNQWFFFRVKNARAETYTFHVMNMTKRSSLYRRGMKVSIFSEAVRRRTGKGWFKGGEDITYTNTRIERATKENQSYYALAWSYTFSEEHDTVYFALNQPYTYTRLANFLEDKQHVFTQNKISIIRKNIGYTLANNLIQSIIITDGNLKKPKKVLLFMARQHPGETAGSFVAEGLIQALSQPSPEASFLIKTFRIVIIPMINPDGVIYGNSRCNLAGLDLNRQWSKQCIKQLTPQTFAIRKYITSLHEEHGIEIMIDLHGHSKKMNSFFYACKKDNKCAMRLFSYVMGKVEESFDVYSCTYGIAKDKVTTARFQLFEMGINAYTLENSYFGKEKNSQVESFLEGDLKKIGYSIVKALFILYADKEEVGNQLFNRQVLMQEIQGNIDKFEAEENKNKNDSGSESDPDGDLLALEERVQSITLRDPLKKQRLIKSFEGILKKKKCMSPIAKIKLELKEKEEEPEIHSGLKEKKQKVSITRHYNTSKHIVTEPIEVHSTKKKLFRPTSHLNKKKNSQSQRNQTQLFQISISRPTNQRERTITDQQVVPQIYPTNYSETFSEIKPNNESRLSQKQPQPSTTSNSYIKERPMRKSSFLQNSRKTYKFSLKGEETNKNLKKQKSVKRHSQKMTGDLETVKTNLNNESLQKSWQLTKIEIDQTQYIKVESLYRQSRKGREMLTPPQNLLKKNAQTKRQFQRQERPQSCQRHINPKYRKFQSFLGKDSGVGGSKFERFYGYYGYGGGFGGDNSVFYRFPML